MRTNIGMAMKTIVRRFFDGASTLAILTLLGCATPVPAKITYDQALRRCQDDAAARWLEPVDRIDRLLLLGKIEDPATTGGSLISRSPHMSLNGGLESWLTKTGLSRVDMYIPAPALDPHLNNNFGPKLGQPGGAYAYERLPENDPRCRSYVRPPDYSDKPVELKVSRLFDGTCVSLHLVGPLDLDNYKFIEVGYFDVQAEAQGYSRYVQELRRHTGQVVARSVIYTLPGNRPTCTSLGDLTEILN